ncbi:MAG: NAD(P)H-hydrate dehydratase [Desulfurispora sp.]|uniref:NAD(P)H-hydrate dehydratase n=1 Tax=Desulfurispora sp. TaxID=3014275 RepID=UPI0040492619
MRAVTAAEMRELDRQAIEEYGIPGLVLMENAGRSIVQEALEMLGQVRGRQVTVFIGKGNNGGDGLVAARHLYNLGAEVKVLSLAPLEEISGDAAVNLAVWQRMGQRVYYAGREEDLNAVRLFLVKTDLIIDAIYGTGFQGQVREGAGKIFDVINTSGKPVLAVDIPSGLIADTGQVGGNCIQATRTVTFALPKVGLLVEPGASLCGQLKVADISIPAVLLESEQLKRHLLDAAVVAGWLPVRRSTDHKGDFGHVLVVAGAAGYSGAAVLCARAAARAGAGLVTLAVPASLQPVVSTMAPEIMTLALPQTERQTVSSEAWPVIKKKLERCQVLALGPGLTTHPETVGMVRELLLQCEVPVVLDADGLNALVGRTTIFRQMKAPLVITPHPGELARLLGVTVEQVQERRLYLAEETAARWRLTLVLKGARTLVACPDGTLYINPTGNPGMASGGSGDVLTGVIAGLLAQGLTAGEAAAAGVYAHGLAGDLAADEKGLQGMLAGDILSCLPRAWQVIRESAPVTG